MKMLLVQHDYEGAWIAGRREDIDAADAPALFYGRPEADAYITAMCGMIHTGGDPRRFRIVSVEFDGLNYSVIE